MNDSAALQCAKKTWKLGATPDGQGHWRFLVWSLHAECVSLHIQHPESRVVRMRNAGDGYHLAEVDGLAPDSRYMFRLHKTADARGDETDPAFPDPASRWQPEGVHGPSGLYAGEFPWTDADWQGAPFSRYIIYELHVGTFTAQGTFDAAISHLDELAELGITAIELMPVAQFPGERNWGYDGVYPFAVQNSYGGPDALKRLVDACHGKGLSVILDVVYNHLGPEGNYFSQFGPYFTDFYKTLWGRALNFDGPDSDPVRRFFIENALYWVETFHIDALRLDAVHAIYDASARPFLQTLARAVHRVAGRLKRPLYCIAESALNDTRVIRSQTQGGWDMDAQWNDDYHHALHTVLTGENQGYYKDFGRFFDMVKAWCCGYVYSGRYSAFRRRRHGSSSRNMPAQKFVVYAQNHDQVGNRTQGERLAHLVTFEQLKLAAAFVLLSPYVPLLFMGEEYGETAPFPCFINHSDPSLVEAVRNGRKAEFAGFKWRGEPPDPQDPLTFASAKLHHDLRYEGRHGFLLAYHKELIRLRREMPALALLTKKGMRIRTAVSGKLIWVMRWAAGTKVGIFLNFENHTVTPRSFADKGVWRKILDSANESWDGPGSRAPESFDAAAGESPAIAPCSVAAYVHETEGCSP